MAYTFDPIIDELKQGEFFFEGNKVTPTHFFSQNGIYYAEVHDIKYTIHGYPQPGKYYLKRPVVGQYANMLLF